MGTIKELTEDVFDISTNWNTESAQNTNLGGSSLDNTLPETYLEIQFSERRRKTWMAIACAFIALTIVASIIAAVQYSFYSNALKTIEAINEELDDVKKQKSSLESRVSSLRSEVSSLENDLWFYRDYVVFVGSGAYPQYYHKDPNCSRFQGDFWAYNINAAVGKGYWPCPLCG